MVWCVGYQYDALDC